MQAAAYARYSTTNQTENSIAYQTDKIREYCGKNNINIVAAYKDEAESGTNTEDRAEFLHMTAAAARKEFQAVVIYDITRGSRDVGDWFNFRKTMKRLNISVISVEDKLGDILNPNDFLLELISVGIGQHSVLTTRQKSIDGVAVKAKQGVFLGGIPPLGYEIVGQKYVINETEAATVRTIFGMYARGAGYAAIIEAVKGTAGKRGRPMGKNSLNAILKNERYIGVYSWNKRIFRQMRKYAGNLPNPNCVKIEGIIPPIIDKYTWGRVRKRMEENKKATNKAKREYLLTGLIECDVCGGTFIGHTSTNARGYENRSYRCGNKYRNRTCNSLSVNADEIETAVIAHLTDYLSTVDFNETAATVVKMVYAASPDLSKEKKELAEISFKIKNGITALLTRPDFTELQDEIDRLRIRKSELEDIIASKSSNRPNVNKEQIVELLKYYSSNYQINIKEAVRELVTKIYAHADGNFTVNVGVDIADSGRGI